ncbi:MAG: OadG family protein [Spirochaetota bacterium]
MISEGFVLAGIGIAVVFIFLFLLVMVLYLIAAIARLVPGGPAAASALPGSKEAEIAAAVAVARARYGSRQTGGSE